MDIKRHNDPHLSVLRWVHFLQIQVDPGPLPKNHHLDLLPGFRPENSPLDFLLGVRSIQ
jgi:hypothetical protein